ESNRGFYAAGLVSGHDFSSAAQAQTEECFSPCGAAVRIRFGGPVQSKTSTFHTVVSVKAKGSHAVAKVRLLIPPCTSPSPRETSPLARTWGPVPPSSHRPASAHGSRPHSAPSSRLRPALLPPVNPPPPAVRQDSSE